METGGDFDLYLSTRKNRKQVQKPGVIIREDKISSIQDNRTANNESYEC